MERANGSDRGSRGSLDKSYEADSGSDSNAAICNNRAVSPSNGASLNSAQNPEHSLDMITTDVTGRLVHIVTEPTELRAEDISRDTASPTQNLETFSILQQPELKIIADKLSEILEQQESNDDSTDDGLFLNKLSEVIKNIYINVKSTDNLTTTNLEILWDSLYKIAPYVKLFDTESKKLTYQLLYSIVNIRHEVDEPLDYTYVEDFFQCKLNTDTDLSQLYYLPVLAELVKNKVTCSKIVNPAIEQILQNIHTGISTTRAVFFAIYMADIIENADDSKQQSIVDQMFVNDKISVKFKIYLYHKILDKKIAVQNNFITSELDALATRIDFINTNKDCIDDAIDLKQRMNADITSSPSPTTEILNKLESSLNNIKSTPNSTEDYKEEIKKYTQAIINNLSAYNNTQESSRAYEIINKVVSLNNQQINENIYKSLQNAYSENTQLLTFEINEDGTIENNNYLPLLKHLTARTKDNSLFTQSLPYILENNYGKNSVFVMQYITATIDCLEDKEKITETVNHFLTIDENINYYEHMLLLHTFEISPNNLFAEKYNFDLNEVSYEYDEIADYEISNTIYNTININHTNSLYNQDGIFIPINISDTSTNELSPENIISLQQLPMYKKADVTNLNIACILNNVSKQNLTLDSIHTYYYAYCFSEILKTVANNTYNFYDISNDLFVNKNISLDFKQVLQVLLISKNLGAKPQIETITKTEAQTILQQIKDFNKILIANKSDVVNTIDYSLFENILDTQSDTINLSEYQAIVQETKRRIQEDLDKPMTAAEGSHKNTRSIEDHDEINSSIPSELEQSTSFQLPFSFSPTIEEVTDQEVPQPTSLLNTITLNSTVGNDTTPLETAQINSTELNSILKDLHTNIVETIENMDKSTDDKLTDNQIIDNTLKAIRTIYSNVTTDNLTTSNLKLVWDILDNISPLVKSFAPEEKILPYQLLYSIFNKSHEVDAQLSHIPAFFACALNKDEDLSQHYYLPVLAELVKNEKTGSDIVKPAIEQISEYIHTGVSNAGAVFFADYMADIIENAHNNKQQSIISQLFDDNKISRDFKLNLHQKLTEKNIELKTSFDISELEAWAIQYDIEDTQLDCIRDAASNFKKGINADIIDSTKLISATELSNGLKEDDTLTKSTKLNTENISSDTVSGRSNEEPVRQLSRPLSQTTTNSAIANATIPLEEELTLNPLLSPSSLSTTEVATAASLDASNDEQPEQKTEQLTPPLNSTINSAIANATNATISPEEQSIANPSLPSPSSQSTTEVATAASLENLNDENSEQEAEQLTTPLSQTTRNNAIANTTNATISSEEQSIANPSLLPSSSQSTTEVDTAASLDNLNDENSEQETGQLSRPLSQTTNSEVEFSEIEELNSIGLTNNAELFSQIKNDLVKLGIYKDTILTIDSSSSGIEKFTLAQTLHTLSGRNNANITTAVIASSSTQLTQTPRSILNEMKEIVQKIKDKQLDIDDIIDNLEDQATAINQPELYRQDDVSPFVFLPPSEDQATAIKPTVSTHSSENTPTTTNLLELQRQDDVSSIVSLAFSDDEDAAIKQTLPQPDISSNRPSTAQNSKTSETLVTKLKAQYILIQQVVQTFQSDLVISSLTEIINDTYNLVAQTDSITSDASEQLWDNLKWILPYINSFEDKDRKLGYKLIHCISNKYPEEIAERIQKTIKVLRDTKSTRKNFFEVELKDEGDIEKHYYLPILEELVKNEKACNHIINSAIEHISQHIKIDTHLSKDRAYFFADYMSDIIVNAHHTKKQQITDKLFTNKQISKKFKGYLYQLLENKKASVEKKSISSFRLSEIKNDIRQGKITELTQYYKAMINNDIIITPKLTDETIQQQSSEQDIAKLDELERQLNDIKSVSTLTETDKTQITKETLEIINNLSTYHNTQESNRVYKIINKVVSFNDQQINEKIYRSLYTEYSNNSNLLQIQINENGEITNNNYLPLLKNLTAMTNNQQLLIQSLPHIIPKNDTENSIFISQYIATTIDSLENNEKKLETLDTALAQSCTADFKKQLLFTFIGDNSIASRIQTATDLKFIDYSAIRDLILEKININHTNSLYNQDSVVSPMNISDTDSTELSRENLKSLSQLGSINENNISIFNIALMLNNIIDKDLKLDSIQTSYCAYYFSEILTKMASKSEFPANIEVIKNNLFKNKSISMDFKKVLQVLLISNNIDSKPHIETITKTEAERIHANINNLHQILENKTEYNGLDVKNIRSFGSMLTTESDEIYLTAYAANIENKDSADRPLRTSTTTYAVRNGGFQPCEIVERTHHENADNSSKTEPQQPPIPNTRQSGSTEATPRRDLIDNIQPHDNQAEHQLAHNSGNTRVTVAEVHRENDGNSHEIESPSSGQSLGQEIDNSEVTEQLSSPPFLPNQSEDTAIPKRGDISPTQSSSPNQPEDISSTTTSSNTAPLMGINDFLTKNISKKMVSLKQQDIEFIHTKLDEIIKHIIKARIIEQIIKEKDTNKYCNMINILTYGLEQKNHHYDTVIKIRKLVTELQNNCSKDLPSFVNGKINNLWLKMLKNYTWTTTLPRYIIENMDNNNHNNMFKFVWTTEDNIANDFFPILNHIASISEDYSMQVSAGIKKIFQSKIKPEIQSTNLTDEQATTIANKFSDLINCYSSETAVHETLKLFKNTKKVKKNLIRNLQTSPNKLVRQELTNLGISITSSQIENETPPESEKKGAAFIKTKKASSTKTKKAASTETKQAASATTEGTTATKETTATDSDQATGNQQDNNTPESNTEAANNDASEVTAANSATATDGIEEVILENPEDLSHLIPTNSLTNIEYREHLFTDVINSETNLFINLPYMFYQFKQMKNDYDKVFNIITNNKLLEKCFNTNNNSLCNTFMSLIKEIATSDSTSAQTKDKVFQLILQIPELTSGKKDLPQPIYGSWFDLINCFINKKHEEKHQEIAKVVSEFPVSSKFFTTSLNDGFFTNNYFQVLTNLSYWGHSDMIYKKLTDISGKLINEELSITDQSKDIAVYAYTLSGLISSFMQDDHLNKTIKLFTQNTKIPKLLRYSIFKELESSNNAKISTIIDNYSKPKNVADKYNSYEISQQIKDYKKAIKDSKTKTEEKNKTIINHTIRTLSAKDQLFMTQLINDSTKTTNFNIPQQHLKTLTENRSLRINILNGMYLHNINDLKKVVSLLAFSKASTYMRTIDIVDFLKHSKQHTTVSTDANPQLPNYLDNMVTQQLTQLEQTRSDKQLSVKNTYKQQMLEIAKTEWKKEIAKIDKKHGHRLQLDKSFPKKLQQSLSESCNDFLIMNNELIETQADLLIDQQREQHSIKIAKYPELQPIKIKSASDHIKQRLDVKLIRDEINTKTQAYSSWDITEIQNKATNTYDIYTKELKQYSSDKIKDMQNEITTKVKHEITQQTQTNVADKIRKEVQQQTQNQVRYATTQEAKTQIENQVEKQIQDQIEETMKSERDKLQEQIQQQTEREIKYQEQLMQEHISQVAEKSEKIIKDIADVILKDQLEEISKDKNQTDSKQEAEHIAKEREEDAIRKKQQQKKDNENNQDDKDDKGDDNDKGKFRYKQSDHILTNDIKSVVSPAY